MRRMTARPGLPGKGLLANRWRLVLTWCFGVSRLAGDGSLARRGERGLSQSTENAILLAGAVAVAGVIVTVITAYVKNHLPG